MSTLSLGGDQMKHDTDDQYERHVCGHCDWCVRTSRAQHRRTVNNRHVP